MNKKKIVDINVFKDLIKFYKIEYKKLYMLMFVVVISGILQAVVPLSIKLLTDDFITKQNLKGFIIAGIGFFSLVIISTLAIYSFYVFGGKLEYQVSKEIRKSVFERIEKFSLTNIKKYETGELISRLTSDVQKLSEVFSWGVIDACHSIIVLLISISIMLYLSYTLTLMLFLILPAIYIVTVIFQKNILKFQRKVRDYNSKIIRSYTESLSYIKTIKALGIEDKKKKEFKTYNEKYRKYNLLSILISAIFVPTVMFVASIGVGFAFNFSSISVMRNVMTYGAFLSFLTYSFQIFEPFKMLAQIFTDLKSAQASAERVFQILYEEDEILEEEESDLDFEGNIKFENVSFHYFDDDKLILKDFNFEIKNGESVAFIGSTGSGKSTIVNLICKFYNPTSGDIYLDGINYRNIDKTCLYNNLGYVLQQPQLFSISIKENIKFGNENATDEEILKVCNLLGIDEFISKLPNGIDTVIGETGYNISGGQKQLISFARALIKNPKLLILDEATSSIDTETEKIIQNKMKDILKGKTSIIVAHRLSTIKHCDKIVLIENGNILEQGTHLELLDKKGIYYKMYISEKLKI
ncbi:ABC transporter ATP-binding protein [Parvimonas micra]|uniref:ABC transporter ATP-binding protein/permease n=1 Tax=Parvimonas micra TaxID=33033 RepID=A0A9X3HAS0_9FIRM|nr:ABC transporter ATP-binding protein [Parvimonas micra]MCZ7407903.1 ABC transporter ATP-binding protein/permease [Parvimonas micra]MCZ7410535.1 ABC transporter ATP-binding protein/permease [Parvimonas micra]MCZ7412267.1 ABC transporter ATP-binding protein/permease [Parvimonas micra]WBB36530.1 ABC transporter ATP-binding protein/permease [Parvimonas micra]